MLRQFLVGAAVSVCNIAIHAFLMAAVIWAARITGAITGSRQSVRLIAVMSATVSLLMAAHFSEVLVWAWAYAIVGVAPKGADLIYFAFVNYTTLGYGDVTPMERWNLLGPMTAMNVVSGPVLPRPLRGSPRIMACLRCLPSLALFRRRTPPGFRQIAEQ
jgi:hypothetical protein